MPLKLKNAAGTDVNYDIHRSEGNRAEYRGPDHTDMSGDVLILSASEPKRTKDSHGNRRSSVKVIRSFTIVDTDCKTSEHRDAKIEILTSIPVGSTAEAIGELFARGADLLLTPELANELAIKGKTQF